MLYYLYEYFTSIGIHIPGLGMFRFISFRAGMAVLLSLIIALVFGKKIISYLRNQQMGELVRDLGLEGQKQKEGTPTIVVEPFAVAASIKECPSETVPFTAT